MKKTVAIWFAAPCLEGIVDDELPLFNGSSKFLDVSAKPFGAQLLQLVVDGAAMLKSRFSPDSCASLIEAMHLRVQVIRFLFHNKY